MKENIDQVIALQGTLEQISERVHELLKEKHQKEEEWDRWCDEMPLHYPGSAEEWTSAVVKWLKRMPR